MLLLVSTVSASYSHVIITFWVLFSSKSSLWCARTTYNEANLAKLLLPGSQLVSQAGNPRAKRQVSKGCNICFRLFTFLPLKCFLSSFLTFSVFIFHIFLNTHAHIHTYTCKCMGVCVCVCIVPADTWWKHWNGSCRQQRRQLVLLTQWQIEYSWQRLHKFHLAESKCRNARQTNNQPKTQPPMPANRAGDV